MIEQFIKYSQLLIMAARPLENRNSAITIHELCSMPRCPPLLLRLAMSPKYNAIFNVVGDTHTPDEDGMLPIHHVVRRAAVTNRFTPPYFGRNGIKSVLELLLEDYPEGASITDSSGRLPLHYALESGQIHGSALLTLVRSFPDALRVQDPASGLFPFMQYAANMNSLLMPQSVISIAGSDEDKIMEEEEENEVERENIEMSYFLLLLCPEAVQYQGKVVCATSKS